MEFTNEQYQWLKKKLNCCGVGIRTTVRHGNDCKVQFENGYQVASMMSTKRIPSEETQKWIDQFERA